MTNDLQILPLEQVFPNPDQPRRTFAEAELQDLAASIREGKPQQPIKVTPRPGGFMIVFGERRWRAHRINGAPTIRALVEEMTDAQVQLAALIENRFRVDVHPMEEAVAFQSAMDKGMTAEELAIALGLQQAWRVTDRTQLLELRPEYQQLFRSGNLNPSQATEMSRLAPSGQDSLFKAIKRGECGSYLALRAAALVLRDAERQTTFLADDAPSDSQRQLARGLERKIGQVAAMLRASTIDNEVVAVRKIDPGRADSIADLLHAMQGDLRRIETALRSRAQLELVA